MPKQYNAVDMVKDFGWTDAEVKQLENRIANRSVSKALAHLRVQADMTQQELANKMNMPLEFVEKLEVVDNETLMMALKDIEV